MSEIFLLLRIVIIALVIIGAILAFLRKIVLKRRLEDGLGREVEKRELTDIGAWMKATPAIGENHITTPAQALKRKHGDVIALTLGVLGLLALALSIVITRYTNNSSVFATSFFVSIVFVIIGLPLGLIALSRAKRFPGTYPSTRPAVAGTLTNVALAVCLLLLTFGILFGGRRFETFLKPSDLHAYANSTSSSAIRALATALSPHRSASSSLQGAPSLNITGRVIKRYLTTDGTKISYSVWSKHKNQRRMLEVASADKPNVLFETKDLRIQYSAVQDNLVLNAIAGPDYIFAEAPSKRGSTSWQTTCPMRVWEA